METNVLGLMRMTRLCLPALIEGEGGHIVNMGSVAGIWSYVNGSSYVASKFAVHGYTRALRDDLQGKPVRITNIAAGMVETNFSAVRFRDEEAGKAVYSNVAMGGPITARGRRRLRALRADPPAERQHRRDHRDGARPGLGRQHPARELGGLGDRRRRRAASRRSSVRTSRESRTGAVAPTTRIAQPINVARVPIAAEIGPTAASASGVSAQRAEHVVGVEAGKLFGRNLLLHRRVPEDAEDLDAKPCGKGACDHDGQRRRAGEGEQGQREREDRERCDEENPARPPAQHQEAAEDEPDRRRGQDRAPRRRRPRDRPSRYPGRAP